MSRVIRLMVLSALLLFVGSLKSIGQPSWVRAGRYSLSEAQKYVRQASGGGLELLQINSHGSPTLLVGRSNLGERWLPASGGATDVQSALISHIPDIKSLLSLPDSAELSLTSVQHVKSLWHASYGLTYHGIPVRERALAANIGEQSGRFVSLINNLPIYGPTTTAVGIPAEALTDERLLELAGGTVGMTVTSAPRLVFVEQSSDGALMLCYEAIVRDPRDQHVWRLTIDASSGELISKEDLLEYVVETPCNGRVTSSIHPHSPFDSTVIVGVPGLTIHIGPRQVTTDSNGYWAVLCPDTCRSTVLCFENAFHKVVRVDTTSASLPAITSGTGNLVEWNDSNSSAAERDAYYSTTIAHQFAKSMDTTLARIDDPATVFVNMNSTCNAYYDPSELSLNFFHDGNNCANTAEISDVVYHEYGHRMLHARYSVTQHGNIVNASINEAFADIFSAFLRDDSRIGIGFFSNNRNAVLRDCFNTKAYPRDISADPHVTGMIIGGAFWDLRRAIGRTAALRLFSDALVLCPDGPNSTMTSDLSTAFTATLLDVLAVDDTDNDLMNGTPNMSAILTSFGKHGVNLANLISVRISRLPDQDSTATGYPVTVTATYSAPIGELALDSVRICYSFDNGHSFNSVPADHVKDSIFAGVIPKAPAGTIVKYYASAKTTIAEAGTASSPSSVDPNSFLVGFRSVLLDDAETDRGWSLSSPTDKATTGLWVRDVPYGTYQVPGIFIQQDTDHSPDGVACYVTGNKHTRVFSEDDVDSGSTTLTTPSFDLSTVASPVIRYWYYYANTIGFYAGRATFLVQISSDDGVTWKTVQNTNVATSGWQSYMFRVSDKVQPSATMRMRFVAADFYLTIIEAGVDDFEVLTGPNPIAAGVSPANPGQFSLDLPTPNPVDRGSRVSIGLVNDRPRHAALTIKNVFGDLVQTAFDAPLSAGSSTIALDVSKLSAGIYWLTLTDGEHHSIRKLIVR